MGLAYILIIAIYIKKNDSKETPNKGFEATLKGRG